MAFSFGKPSNALTGGAFSNLGTSTTSQPAQPSLFGTTQNKPLFGQSLTQPTQNLQTNSVFNTTQNQQPSAFGLGAQNQQQSAFGLSNQQNNQQNMGQSQLGQSQRPLDQTLRFGFGESQQTLAQAQDSKDAWWQEGRGMGVYRSIPEQMQLIRYKWDPASLNSPLRAYLYQHVESETEALRYSPGQYEDADKWEEAVQKRPGPDWVPAIARGFRELSERAKQQKQAIAQCNMMLHEINTSLDIQLDVHRQKVAARLDESRRRHKAISQRTLALAVKVQMLKNKGYVMDNAEEELKSKLHALESQVLDPSINAREQEIWARMLGIRERARYLKAEMEKLEPVANDEEPLLDESTIKLARKVRSPIRPLYFNANFPTRHSTTMIRNCNTSKKSFVSCLKNMPIGRD